MKKEDIKTFHHPDYDNYLKPDSLKDKYLGKRALIIGSGPSSEKLLQYRDKIREKFDVVVSLNLSMKDFQEYSDYHMVLERKPTVLAKWVRENRTNERLIHVLNSRAIRYFPTGIPIIRSDRVSETEGPSGKDCLDVRNYTDGLIDRFIDLAESTSVMVQALHLVGIFGCSNIHICGGEMFYRDAQHYYAEESMSHKSLNRLDESGLKEKMIEFNGETYCTIPAYMNSAIAANRLIKDEFSKHNISVSDFSNGLITEAIQVNIDDFFGQKGV